VTTAVSIYARYSTDRQDARSIEDQVRRCRRFADERGWDVAAEFTDAAQSGASLARASLQRLLAAARARNAAFAAVLVDDLSRLSRDLGDAWGIIFGDLASAGIRVVDCTTGRASNERGARLTFGVTALMNDAFLDSVRAETHRGLEGRALAGFHTGGRCYGYTTEPEPNPPDPEHPRAVVRIDPGEAKVVRRIFERHVAGESLRRIASALNVEGVPAPYDRLAYGKPAGKGWATNQVHSMLRNERYVGRIVWNKREWYRDPLTKKRRARIRDEKEWIVTEAPELAIVDRETWDAAQARHRQVKRGGQTNGKKKVRLLSGFLRCGVCGAGLAIIASTKKRGQVYSRYGCSANHGKGDSVCPNRRMISERVVTAQVLQGIRAYVQSPDFQGWLDEALAGAARAVGKRGSDEETELEAAVRAQQAKAERTAAAVIAVGVSETLRAALLREEEQLRALRMRLAEVRRPKVIQLQAMDLSRAAEAVREIEALAAVDPEQARARLAQYLDHATVTPREDSGVVVHHIAVELRKTTAALVGRPVVDECGCGGPMQGSSTTTGNPSFPLLVGRASHR